MNPVNVLIGFTLLVVARAELPGQAIRFKSLCEAELECQQYLQSADKSTPNCLRRCELLVLRSWNDSTGLLGLPFSQHFQPDCDDTDYLNRTRKCITDGEACVPGEDVCRRASIDWQCYVEQFGTIHVKDPKYVPAADQLVINALGQCASMLQVEQQELETYIRSGYKISAKARCLLRCLYTRLGLWDDVTGLNVERLIIQCGGYGLDGKALSERVHQCEVKLRTKCYDKCTLLSRVLNDCFPENMVLGVGLGTVLAVAGAVVTAVSSIVAAASSGNPLALIGAGLAAASNIAAVVSGTGSLSAVPFVGEGSGGVPLDVDPFGGL